ncbi:MAG: two-component system phosphate regulon sensor histidine kinase PhoR [Cyclobacteriaceae bacterium]|jgi:two-component system phosphate regulon sensor histidine kinase PhoR
MVKYSRTILILIFAIVLPFLLYAVIQIKSLKDDERLAQQIYQKQMETVLFSLNTHANDRVEQWMRQLSNEKKPTSINASELISGNESIQMLVLRKMINSMDSIYLNEYIDVHSDIKSGVNDWYSTKDTLIHRLTGYLEGGYQKIQAATDWQAIDQLKPSQSGIIAMFYDHDSTLYNALFILETNFWVEQALGSKMQELAQGNFTLGVMRASKSNEDPNIIYSTDNFDLLKDYIKNKFWIIPDTFLSIQPSGLSFTEIVRNRSEKNLYILLASIFVMLIGTLYMVKHIQSTMKLAQLKSDFVSNVSHEIRTPLSLIKMYAETLMLGRLSSEEKKQHYYNVIHHESGRLTYLVNNILDFSKIEANKKTYNKTREDMNSLVQAIYHNYSYTLEEKKAKCTLEVHSEPLNIEVDVQAFDEALSNLIENAVKYSKENIRIDIKTRIKGGFAYCDVSDQGIGIPKKVQENIFEKFYRVEDALTQKTKGAGLGLSLVSHIMSAHEGEVLMKSKADQGSTFTLKFPLSDEK